MPDYIHIRSTDPVYRHLPKTEAQIEQVGRHAIRYLWPRDLVDAARLAHPVKVVVKVPPVTVDILAAVFGVNRAAKRYRDAAQMHYQNGTHSFAGACKDKKQSLYGLKDRGIVAGFRAGRLKAEGIHGVLTVYRGEGYCFHSLLRPVSLTLPELEFNANEAGCLFIEQKPKTAREPRLKDSVFTLESIPESEFTEFKKLSFPPRAPRRVFTYEDVDGYDGEELPF